VGKNLSPRIESKTVTCSKIALSIRQGDCNAAVEAFDVETCGGVGGWLLGVGGLVGRGLGFIC